MKNLSFVIIVLLSTLFSCKNTSQTESVTVFDSSCNKFQIDIKHTPLLYEDSAMWICENPGFRDRYTAFVKKCGNFTFDFDSLHLKGVRVGAFQGNVLHFDTELPFEEASEKIFKIYALQK